MPHHRSCPPRVHPFCHPVEWKWAIIAGQGYHGENSCQNYMIVYFLRQTDKHIERQTDKETDRETDTHTHTHTHTHRETEINKQTDNVNQQTDRQTGRQTNGYITSGLGDHSLTTGSIPLVARIQAVGCGWRQLTIESSPRSTRTILVVDFSQRKNDPSSEPATIYWPLLKNRHKTSARRFGQIHAYSSYTGHREVTTTKCQGNL